MAYKNTVILRFRDLVTEENGTIKEHLRIIEKFGEVWWGWWMRQYESSPRTFIQTLQKTIKKDKMLPAYLFNTGSTKLYTVLISEIKQGPSGICIPTPDPEKSPSYYHRGQYPVWFLLQSLEKADIETEEIYYDAFPTRPELKGQYAQLLGQKITSLEQLRHFDVTLWSVRLQS